MSRIRVVRSSWLLTVYAAVAACSVFNRQGPSVTCDDLQNGAINACKEGIIASCVDGVHVAYQVCTGDDGADTCSQSWQTAGAYRCSRQLSDSAGSEASEVPSSGGPTPGTSSGRDASSSACNPDDLMSDENNCGVCGHTCSSPMICKDAACTCLGWYSEAPPGTTARVDACSECIGTKCCAIALADKSGAWGRAMSAYKTCVALGTDSSTCLQNAFVGSTDSNIQSLYQCVESNACAGCFE